MPIPQVFCPVPQSESLLREAVEDVAAGCAPVELCMLAVFERTPPVWFAIIGRSQDFAEATGIEKLRLSRRLWNAGFYSDQIAILVDAPSRAWGFRVWGQCNRTSSGAEVIRAIARECGFRLPG